MENNAVKMNVNQFPSLTWNHLNINRTSFEGSICQALDFELENATGLEITEGVGPCDGARSILTGMGKDFDNYLDGLSSLEEIGFNSVTVPENFTMNGEATVTLQTQGQTKGLLDFYIQARENSRSSFVFIIDSAQDFSGLMGLRIRTNIQENASVKIAFVNLNHKASDAAVGFVTIGSVVEDNGHFEIYGLDLVCPKNYSSFHNWLKGYRSSFEGRFVYYGRSENFIDLNHVCLQTGKETSSKWNVDGILCDMASKAWRGTIDFKKGCAASSGDEQENVLLLNPEIVNKSLPVILCDEEDVEGRHGCSIGKLDTDSLFYMQSRGVDFESARKLIIKSKINQVTSNIQSQELKDQIEEIVEGVI